ncbi:MAG: discoidin domain-containing protein [Deltaproteobacteria bacterium]
MHLESTLANALAWLRSRWPELALFALGTLLRLSMAWSYEAGWAYDADGHWAVLEWIREHHAVPSPEAVLHSFHPPLYYVAGAWLVEHGVSRAHLVWVSILCGVLRLGLLWLWLELFLPASRRARLAALALAAVLASSVHPDGMVYSEALSGLWVALGMLLVPLAFQRAPRARWRWAASLGLVLGLALLTKISGFVLLVTVGLAALIELVSSGRPWRRRLLDAAAWASTLLVCLAVCGWYFGRNVRDYGRPFVTSFDLPSQHGLVAPVDDVPALHRRSLGYFVSWDPAVNLWPFGPAGLRPYPSFFPVMIASTFTDYYNFSFSGIDAAEPSPMKDALENRPVSIELLSLARGAVLGGMAIFVATVAAWLIAARRLLQDKDFGRLALVLVPALGLAAALHFATLHPVDDYGVVKGVYLQFAAPPLYALFGLAVDWLSQRRARLTGLAVLGVAFWLVAGYTSWCRLRVPLLPTQLFADRHPPRNLALAATATASSTQRTRAQGAIDGIRYGQLGFRSRSEPSPWFLLDLGQPKTIERLVIYAGHVCCQEQALPLVLESSDDGVDFQPVATRQRRFTQFQPWRVRTPQLTARFVRLRAVNPTELTLAEVEVYERP